MNIQKLVQASLKTDQPSKFLTTVMKYQGELNTAFTKFQQQVKAPAKNGHVSYRAGGGPVHYDYVMLDDLIKAINQGLKGTGLLWQQKAKTTPHSYQEANRNGSPVTKFIETVSVSTIIKYKNGWESEPDSTTVVVQNPSVQNIGSAMSYARRYSLAATFGISSNTDTDGAQQSNPRNNSSYSGYRVNNSTKKASPKQMNFINSLINQLAKAKSTPVKNIQSEMIAFTHANSVSTMTSAQASKAITALKSFINGEHTKQQAK